MINPRVHNGDLVRVRAPGLKPRFAIVMSGGNDEDIIRLGGGLGEQRLSLLIDWTEDDDDADA